MTCAGVTVVMITRDRAAALRNALGRLSSLPDAPPVIVVDNASVDATSEVITAAGSNVKGIRLRHNLGAAGRNAGVQAARTPYVAFSDDDSWWAPGALSRAAPISAATRGSACLPLASSSAAQKSSIPNARRWQAVLCDRRPTCLARASWASSPAAPSCGAALFWKRRISPALRRRRRRNAALHRPYARGSGLAYCDDVTAVHHPEPGAARPGRRARLVRNRLWTAWLRFSAGAAWTATTRTAHAALSDGGVRAGFCDAVRGMPWVLRERLPVDPSLDRDLGRVLACP